MEEKDRTLIEQLIGDNEELRQLWQDHQELERKIAKLDKRIHLSTDEVIERKKLQKLKLAGKDKIEKILLQYR